MLAFLQKTQKFTSLQHAVFSIVNSIFLGISSEECRFQYKTFYGHASTNMHYFLE